MKKVNKKILFLTSMVCLLPMLLGFWFYQQLPEQVAIHFDMNNQPNGYFSKFAFVVGMPILMMVLQIFCCVISDWNDKNQEANQKAMAVYKWLIPTITVCLYIVTILYALGITLDIRKVVMFILGVIFILVGNYLPKTKGNFSIHPFTRKQEEASPKLVRKMGYCLILDGFLSFASTLFSPAISVAVIVIMLLQIIGLCGYGALQTKRTEKN